jgi:prophage antirepressor-like protein
MTREGEPWFVLADVCNVLDIDNPSRVADRLDEDERALHTVKDANGRPQSMNIINESGLYSLVLTSRKPDARLDDDARG